MSPRPQGANTKERFIWLKNPWNLTEDQALRLGEIERFNLKINRAYLLNELFRYFWDYHRAAWAKKYLTKWFAEPRFGIVRCVSRCAVLLA